jgi:hypothetical protein
MNWLRFRFLGFLIQYTNISTATFGFNYSIVPMNYVPKPFNPA